jgi:hypothetical protein
MVYAQLDDEAILLTIKKLLLTIQTKQSPPDTVVNLREELQGFYAALTQFEARLSLPKDAHQYILNCCELSIRLNSSMKSTGNWTSNEFDATIRIAVYHLVACRKMLLIESSWDKLLVTREFI